MGSLEDKIRESREKAQESVMKEETVSESTLQDVVERSRQKIESELKDRLEEPEKGEGKELEKGGSKDIREEVPDRIVGYHEAWNTMIEHLREARRIWEEQFKGIARNDVDTFRGAAAKALSVSRRGGFDMFLSKLLDFWRTIGGLDNLGMEIHRVMDEEKQEG